MDMQEAQAEFDAAAAEFDALLATVPKDRLPVEGPSIFAKTIDAVRSLLGRKGISRSDAWDGMVAARQVLAFLRARATNSGAVAAYSRLLRLNTNEMAKFIGDEWSGRSALYTPYTEAFRKAAGELEAAKRNAIELADGLNLAADVLGAFSKLVSAVSAAPPVD